MEGMEGRQNQTTISIKRTIDTFAQKAHLLGLKDKKFHFNTIETLLTLRMIEHWNKFPRNLMEPTSLETFKTSPDMALGNLL